MNFPSAKESTDKLIVDHTTQAQSRLGPSELQKVRESSGLSGLQSKGSSQPPVGNLSELLTRKMAQLNRSKRASLEKGLTQNDRATSMLKDKLNEYSDLGENKGATNCASQNTLCGKVNTYAASQEAATNSHSKTTAREAPGGGGLRQQSIGEELTDHEREEHKDPPLEDEREAMQLSQALRASNNFQDFLFEYNRDNEFDKGDQSPKEEAFPRNNQARGIFSQHVVNPPELTEFYEEQLDKSGENGGAEFISPLVDQNLPDPEQEEAGTEQLEASQHHQQEAHTEDVDIHDLTGDMTDGDHQFQFKYTGDIQPPSASLLANAHNRVSSQLDKGLLEALEKNPGLVGNMTSYEKELLIHHQNQQQMSNQNSQMMMGSNADLADFTDFKEIRRQSENRKQSDGRRREDHHQFSFKDNQNQIITSLGSEEIVEDQESTLQAGYVGSKHSNKGSNPKNEFMGMSQSNHFSAENTSGPRYDLMDMGRRMLSININVGKDGTQTFQNLPHNQDMAFRAGAGSDGNLASNLPYTPPTPASQHTVTQQEHPHEEAQPTGDAPSDAQPRPTKQQKLQARMKPVNKKIKQYNFYHHHHNVADVEHPGVDECIGEDFQEDTARIGGRHRHSQLLMGAHEDIGCIGEDEGLRQLIAKDDQEGDREDTEIDFIQQVDTDRQPVIHDEDMSPFIPVTSENQIQIKSKHQERPLLEEEVFQRRDSMTSQNHDSIEMSSSLNQDSQKISTVGMGTGNQAMQSTPTKKSRGMKIIVRKSHVSEPAFTEVYVFGDDSHGQLGLEISSTQNRQLETFRPVPKGCNFKVVIKQVACGRSHSAMLTLSGSLYMMGSNEFSQLGVASLEKPSLEKITEEGTFRSPDPEKKAMRAPLLIPTLKDVFVKKVECGSNFTVALGEMKHGPESKNKKQLIYVWGCNKFGQLGLDDEEETKQDSTKQVHKIDNLIADQQPMDTLITVVPQPTLLSSRQCMAPNTKIVDFSCGEGHTLFLGKSPPVDTATSSDQVYDIYACGLNTSEQCCLSSKMKKQIRRLTMIGLPKYLQSSKIGSIKAGFNHTLVLCDNTGIVYQAGSKSVEPKKGKVVPVFQQVLIQEPIKSIKACKSSAGLSASGKVYYWTNPEEIYSPSLSDPETGKALKIKSIALSKSFSVLLDSSKKMYLWGSLQQDPPQEAFSFFTEDPAQVKPKLLSHKTIKAIYAGDNFMFALGRNILLKQSEPTRKTSASRARSSSKKKVPNLVGAPQAMAPMLENQQFIQYPSLQNFQPPSENFINLFQHHTQQQQQQQPMPMSGNEPVIAIHDLYPSVTHLQKWQDPLKLQGMPAYYDFQSVPQQYIAPVAQQAMLAQNPHMIFANGQPLQNQVHFQNEVDQQAMDGPKTAHMMTQTSVESVKGKPLQATKRAHSRSEAGIKPGKKTKSKNPLSGRTNSNERNGGLIPHSHRQSSKYQNLQNNLKSLAKKRETSSNHSKPRGGGEHYFKDHNGQFILSTNQTTQSSGRQHSTFNMFHDLPQQQMASREGVQSPVRVPVQNLNIDSSQKGAQSPTFEEVMGKQQEKMLQATTKINGILKKQERTKQMKEAYSGGYNSSVGRRASSVKQRTSSVKRSSDGGGVKRALNKSQKRKLSRSRKNIQRQQDQRVQSMHDVVSNPSELKSSTRVKSQDSSVMSLKSAARSFERFGNKSPGKRNVNVQQRTAEDKSPKVIKSKAKSAVSHRSQEEPSGSKTKQFQNQFMNVVEYQNHFDLDSQGIKTLKTFDNVTRPISSNAKSSTKRPHSSVSVRHLSNQSRARSKRSLSSSLKSQSKRKLSSQKRRGNANSELDKYPRYISSGRNLNLSQGSAVRKANQENMNITNHSGSYSMLKRKQSGLSSKKRVTVNDSFISDKPEKMSTKAFVCDLKSKMKHQKNEIKILLEDNIKKDNHIQRLVHQVERFKRGLPLPQEKSGSKNGRSSGDFESAFTQAKSQAEVKELKEEVKHLRTKVKKQGLKIKSQREKIVARESEMKNLRKSSVELIKNQKEMAQILSEKHLPMHPKLSAGKTNGNVSQDVFLLTEQNCDLEQRLQHMNLNLKQSESQVQIKEKLNSELQAQVQKQGERLKRKDQQLKQATLELDELQGGIREFQEQTHLIQKDLIGQIQLLQSKYEQVMETNRGLEFEVDMWKSKAQAPERVKVDRIRSDNTRKDHMIARLQKENADLEAATKKLTTKLDKQNYGELVSRVSGLFSKKSSCEPTLQQETINRREAKREVRTSRFEQEKRNELVNARSPSDAFSKRSMMEKQSNDLVNSAFRGNSRHSYQRLNEDIREFDHREARGVSANQGQKVTSLLSKQSFERFDPKADLKDMISEKLKSRRQETLSKSQERSFDRYRKEQQVKSPKSSEHTSVQISKQNHAEYAQPKTPSREPRPAQRASYHQADVGGHQNHSYLSRMGEVNREALRLLKAEPPSLSISKQSPAKTNKEDSVQKSAKSYFNFPDPHASSIKAALASTQAVKETGQTIPEESRQEEYLDDLRHRYTQMMRESLERKASKIHQA